MLSREPFSGIILSSTFTQRLLSVTRPFVPYVTEANGKEIVGFITGKAFAQNILPEE